MGQLLYYSLALGPVLLLIGFLVSRRSKQRIWFFLMMPVAAALLIAPVLFLLQNSGRISDNPGIAVGRQTIDTWWLHVIGITAGLVLVGGLIARLRTRKFWPGMLIMILTVVQVVIYLMLVALYSR